MAGPDFWMVGLWIITEQGQSEVVGEKKVKKCQSKAGRAKKAEGKVAMTSTDGVLELGVLRTCCQGAIRTTSRCIEG